MKKNKKKIRLKNLHYCPSCDKPIAKDSLEFARHEWSLEKTIVPLNGATLEQREGEADRIKCSCGRVMILLQGSV